MLLAGQKQVAARVAPQILEAIANGDVDLAFRRWKRPTVRAGGSLTTKIGVLAIDSVEVVTMTSITDQDATRAGYASRDELVDQLRSREGKVYRVALRLAGEDPRIQLRNNSELTDEELANVAKRLERMDARSSDGPWTVRVLTAIREQPAVRAGDLATDLGMERKPFKQLVRRLKGLGLTESLKIGYRLSPRGETVAKHVLG